VVLAHRDFAPVNVLTDVASVTGLLDFESVRPADPLFDVAWWAWAVSFSSPSVLEAASPAFLQGAGIDATRSRAARSGPLLQMLRMLELLVGKTSLDAGVQHVAADRLCAMLR
jgi:aminoglycoside phosphotransferase (APT) family kinase protein